jgi:putative hydrolase of the HAD superfamily
MPTKAVLFDMFDTLMLIEKNHDFYSPALKRMYTYLQGNGITTPFERFVEVYDHERDRIYAEADANWEEPHFNVRVSATLTALGYDYPLSSPIVAAATDEFCSEFMKYVRLDPDATPMLNQLHGKYRLGVISNFAIPECVIKLLKTAGIDGFFEVITVSAAINKRKPSPEIFESTLKLLEVSAGETVFVGDTIDADVEGPKAVGMKAVYIERRAQRAPKVCPDQTIKRLSELPLALMRC